MQSNCSSADNAKLFQALSEHNAKVYLCARSEQKAVAAIEKLKQATGKDNVHFLKLDLADIPSAAAAAKELLTKERKIDILFLNAYFSRMSSV